MGWVANVMISISFEEEPSLVKTFSEWLRNEAPWNGPSDPPGATGVGFLRDLMEPPAAGWGGWKNPEGVLWACASNHADVEAIVDNFASFPWRHANVAQLFIKDQDQDYFRVWMIVDGRATLLTPIPPAGRDDLEV